MTTTIIEPISAERSRTLLEKIRLRTDDLMRGTEELRRYVHEFHTGRGWVSLGYPSFKSCCDAELGISWQHAYKLIDAEEVIRKSDLLPEGIPTSHAQALAPLKTPERRSVAYQRAAQLAATEGEGTPIQARHVETVVHEELTRDRVNTHPLKLVVIGQMMNTGEVTPDAAWAIHEHLFKVPPRVRGYIVQLIGQHSLTCPDLVLPLADLFQRRDKGDHSKVLTELLATGRLAEVPLKKATLSDLKRANKIAADEHLREELERRRKLQGWVEEVITIRKGDPAYTAEMLAKTLGPFDLLAVIGELQAIAAKGFEG